MRESEAASSEFFPSSVVAGTSKTLDTGALVATSLSEKCLATCTVGRRGREKPPVS